MPTLSPEVVTEGCSFTECSFDRAELIDSVHLRSAFVACSFERTALARITLTDCKLAGSVFTDSPLHSAKISGGDFHGASPARIGQIRSGQRCAVQLGSISACASADHPTYRHDACY